MASANSLGAAVPNVFDLHTQDGPSDFDSRQIASLSWIWDLPRLAGVHAAAGGWRVNGLILRHTGIALSGTPNQRPNVVGDPGLPGGRSRGDRILAWFNRAAFVRPGNGTFGNAGWPKGVSCGAAVFPALGRISWPWVSGRGPC